jgi:hypothetical protein
VADVTGSSLTPIAQATLQVYLQPVKQKLGTEIVQRMPCSDQMRKSPHPPLVISRVP